MYVLGQLLTPPYAVLQIAVLPCFTYYSNGALCPNSSWYFNLKMVVILPFTSFDPSNYENPITRVPAINREVFVNLYDTTNYYYFLKQSVIMDDQYDFFPPVQKSTFVDIDETKLVMSYRQPTYYCVLPNLTGCKVLLYVYINSGGKSITITRSYSKIFNVLGEIGGFTEVALLITGVGLIIYKCCAKPTDHFSKNEMVDDDQE